MPQILIRKLESKVVLRLRERAVAEGVSAEEEARRILRKSLLGDEPDLSLIDFLRTMPEIDDDGIFDRPKTKARNVQL